MILYSSYIYFVIWSRKQFFLNGEKCDGWRRGERLIDQLLLMRITIACTNLQVDEIGRVVPVGDGCLSMDWTRFPIWLEHCWFVSNRGGRYTAANVPPDLLDLIFHLSLILSFIFPWSYLSSFLDLIFHLSSTYSCINTLRHPRR